jgi:hypothetical protein
VLFVVALRAKPIDAGSESRKVYKMRNCMWGALYCWIVLSLCSCEERTSVDTGLFEEPKPMAELTDSRLKEPSGIAASAKNPGLLWTHNDSGNSASVFLIDEKLSIRLTCKLDGVYNRDWEDIAVGPGPDAGKSYVYIGDIGDNFGMFPFKYLYRFEEPVLKEGETEIVITKFDTITFRLEDGAKDTETLMVNPINRKIYVVSKREDPVWVYELPSAQQPKDTLTATKLVSLPYSRIVGGDFSSNGKELLLKNYQQVFYWKVEGTDLKKSLTSKPTLLPYNEEPQGEAITFKHDGSGYFTLSEKLGKFKSFLYFYKRK